MSACIRCMCMYVCECISAIFVHQMDVSWHARVCALCAYAHVHAMIIHTYVNVIQISVYICTCIYI